MGQSVSGTLDGPRVIAPSKTCGHLRSSRRRWRWAQCRARSAAPTFGRVVLAGASTPAWCPVYRLHSCAQPGVVWNGLVSLPVVAARDQKWRVASDKSGLLNLLRQFGWWLRRSWQNGINGFLRSVVGSSCGTLLIAVRRPSRESMDGFVTNLWNCVSNSPLMSKLVAWHSGRTLFFDRRTFPVLRSTCSWRVTTKQSAEGQPARPTQPFLSGYMNE